MATTNRTTEVALQAAVESPAEEQKPAKPAKEDALKKLRRAVGDEVREQSVTIAKSLVDSTLKGNSNSARLVVSLVDKRPKNKAELKKLKMVASKTHRSTAMDLASEPEWQDEDNHKVAGEPGGSRDE
jgi:hypothetical protein